MDLYYAAKPLPVLTNGQQVTTQSKYRQFRCQLLAILLKFIGQQPQPGPFADANPACK
jgi:hypothetical protein